MESSLPQGIDAWSALRSTALECRIQGAGDTKLRPTMQPEKRQLYCVPLNQHDSSTFQNCRLSPISHTSNTPVSAMPLLMRAFLSS